MEKYILKIGNVEKTVEVADFWAALEAGKEEVRSAVKSGAKDPKVYVFSTYCDGKIKVVPADAIMSKKDIAEKKIMEVSLTKLELSVLTAITESYKKTSVDDTDYYNVFGSDNPNAKAIRGALASLTHKQVINRNDCPDCFNPIFPDINFSATAKKYGLHDPHYND